MQQLLTQFFPVSGYFFPLRSEQSAAGLLWSSADHRPGASGPVRAEQDTVIPAPRNIAKRSRGRVAEIRRACSSVCPRVTNLRTAGRICIKLVVEEMFIGRANA